MVTRKRDRSSLETSAAKCKVGYCATWKQDFTWHEPVNAAAGTVVAVLCSLCKRHHRRQRNKVGTWSEKPCTLLRKDILQRHKESSTHREAELLETARLASKKDGGIKQALSARVVVQTKASIVLFIYCIGLQKRR